jgi:hypothetical protein
MESLRGALGLRSAAVGSGLVLPAGPYGTGESSAMKAWKEAEASLEVAMSTEFSTIPKSICVERDRWNRVQVLHKLIQKRTLLKNLFIFKVRFPDHRRSVGKSLRLNRSHTCNRLFPSFSQMMIAMKARLRSCPICRYPCSELNLNSM